MPQSTPRLTADNFLKFNEIMRNNKNSSNNLWKTAKEYFQNLAKEIAKKRCEGYKSVSNGMQERITNPRLTAGVANYFDIHGTGSSDNMSYSYMNKDGEVITRTWTITNEEFRNANALTQEQITDIIKRKNPELIERGLDIAIYNISHERGINPKVILATLQQEQGWGNTGNYDKLFGVGAGGAPNSYSDGEYGGLRDAVNTYIKLFEEGLELEQSGSLTPMLINQDSKPYAETSAKLQGQTSNWQNENPQYVEYMENGVEVQPVNAAMYAKMRYTPWVDFPPEGSNPIDDWLEIYNSF